MLASPLRDETGHVIGGALIGRDVTKAREAETGLRASQLRFRALSHQAPVGIFEADLSGRCTFVNEAWCGLTGIPEADALGAAWNQAVHPDDLARVGFAWDETVEQGRTFRLEYRIRRPNGSVLWVTGAAEPLQDARGRVLGYLGTAADVSERRRVEEDLRRTTDALATANRELEAFSYSVSHDLRAPLRGIDGFSRALEEDSGERLDEEGRRYLARIRHATRRMGQIIDDLLLPLAGGAQRVPARTGGPRGPGPRGLRVAAGRRAPRATSRFAVGEGLVADADGRLLRLVLENLLGNAWKYTAKLPARPRGVRGPGGERPDRLLYSRRWRGVRHGLCGQALRRVPAPPQRRASSPAPGSVSPPWPGSCTATAAGSGRRARPARGATFFFTLGPGGAA